MRKALKPRISFYLAVTFLAACNANSPENKFFLAEKFLEDRKYEAAVNEFQEISDKSPRSALGLEAQYKIAQIQHLYLGRPKEAINSYKDFLRRTKDENARREVEKILADLEFQDFENYDEAIHAYSKLVKESKGGKGDEELLYKIGRSLYLKASFDPAIKVFEHLKSRFPRGAYFWKSEIEIAYALSAKGQCLDGLKNLDKVIADGPKDMKVLAEFAKAICYEEQDELEKAYDIFNKIKDVYPSPSVVELKMLKIKRRKIIRKR